MRFPLTLSVVSIALAMLPACRRFEEPGVRRFPSAEDSRFLEHPASTDVPIDPKAHPVPPPPFGDGQFPCEDCHQILDPEFELRVLEEHTQIVLNHGDRKRWCFDCHNPENRDVLRLASGDLVPFTESYRLCGQCHGDRYRDWRLGIHGKRTGSWNGDKQYLLCVHCHNPHAPRFEPIAPEPPPTPPAEIGL